MRAFLADLERRGALVHVTAELSPRLEIPYALAWYDRRGGPAVRHGRRC